jgi:hypothetical protein
MGITFGPAPSWGEDDLVWFPSVSSRVASRRVASSFLFCAASTPTRLLLPRGGISRRHGGTLVSQESWRRVRRSIGRGRDGGRLQRRPWGAEAGGGGVRAAAADRVGGVLAGVFGAARDLGHGGGSEGDRHGAAQQQTPREPAFRGRHPSPHPPP